MEEGHLFIRGISAFRKASAQQFSLSRFIQISVFCVAHFCVTQKYVMNKLFEFRRELGD